MNLSQAHCINIKTGFKPGGFKWAVSHLYYLRFLNTDVRTTMRYYSYTESQNG